jgi:hypothetical protein
MKQAELRGLGKVDKVYLDNTNIIFNLVGDKSNIGNIRETFFFNQMRLKNEIISSEKADFVIDNYTFEIGGKNKQQKQIEKDGKSFVVKDDIEFGYLNVIPLWAFGLKSAIQRNRLLNCKPHKNTCRDIWLDKKEKWQIKSDKKWRKFIVR